MFFDAKGTYLALVALPALLIDGPTAAAGVLAVPAMWTDGIVPALPPTGASVSMLSMLSGPNRQSFSAV